MTNKIIIQKLICKYCKYLLQTTPVDKIIKLGEALSLLVYVKSTDESYDVRVRDCWAYDNENYESPTTTSIQLTDASGCPKYVLT